MNYVKALQEMNVHFTTKPGDGQVSWKGKEYKYTLLMEYIHWEVLTHLKHCWQ